MHRLKIRALRATLLALLLSLSGPAWARCGIEGAGMSFGDYDPLSTAPTNGNGSILISCTSSRSGITVSLSSGSGSYSGRRMRGSLMDLSYNLYRDVNRTIIWGDGTGGTAVYAGPKENVRLDIYGKIPAQQNVRAGTYSDTIVVTVTY
jgi:spore coat protein U-like protein